MAPTLEAPDPYAVQKKRALDVPQKEATIVLARGAMESWLRSHGKPKRPEMNKKQHLELRECFDLIDAEGNGVIPAQELPLAFTVLNMDVTRSEIVAANEEFNADRPIMEFPKFMQLMLSKLDKLPADEFAPQVDSMRTNFLNMLVNSLTEHEAKMFPLERTKTEKEGGTFLSTSCVEYASGYINKLMEAVMGGDKPLRDRMNYRSRQVFRERQILRDLAAGKPVQEPESTPPPMTVETDDREKKRRRAAALKTTPKPEPPEPDVPTYVIQSMESDVKELLLGEKRNDIIKAALESEVEFVPPTNKSIELDKPIEFKDGDKKLSKAYLAYKLAMFRTDLQHKPAKKAQIIHVQAIKSLRDFIDKGAWQVKGSPLLYPASRRPSIC